MEEPHGLGPIADGDVGIDAGVDQSSCDAEQKRCDQEHGPGRSQRDADQAHGPQNTATVRRAPEPNRRVSSPLASVETKYPAT